MVARFGVRDITESIFVEREAEKLRDSVQWIFYRMLNVTANRSIFMKRRIFLSIGVSLSLLLNARADLSYTFDEDAQDFQNFSWSATGPSGWSGGAALQATPSSGGWTLGGSFNYLKEFSWPDQVEMQSLAASGQGRLSFDLILDGSSFTPGVANWYNVNIAGNSAGANGWTQFEKLSGDAWHNADDNALYSTHVDVSFAELGWADPEDATGWFQLYFGANSADDFPIQFYIDNVTAYAVPEPSALALGFAGVMALAGWRRRQA